MENHKKDKKLIGAGVITAIAASLCCITPVLALFAGASGIASTFSWIESFRPYLIGLTILVLVYAWYKKLKPVKQDELDCACEDDKKPSFWQSKKFLGIVTVFAVVMLAFPSYSSVFYPKAKKEIVIADKANFQTINIKIEGMTCNSCEEHINHSINQIDGIINVESSYKNGNTEIEFDNSKTTVEEIEKAVNSTGYSIINANEK